MTRKPTRDDEQQSDPTPLRVRRNEQKNRIAVIAHDRARDVLVEVEPAPVADQPGIDFAGQMHRLRHDAESKSS